MRQDDTAPKKKWSQPALHVLESSQHTRGCGTGKNFKGTEADMVFGAPRKGTATSEAGVCHRPSVGPGNAVGAS